MKKGFRLISVIAQYCEVIAITIERSIDTLRAMPIIATKENEFTKKELFGGVNWDPDKKPNIENGQIKARKALTVFLSLPLPDT